jgi:DNA repair protein SbcD/Mre11
MRLGDGPGVPRGRDSRMADSLKLIHATRLLLDEPVLGAGPLSGEERRLVEDATITAFHRIVEACVDRRADLLILSGDTFDETSFTLRARATLTDGLDTLDEQGVSVFITPGTMDSAISWRRLGNLPDSVTLFTGEKDAPVEITDRGKLLGVVSCLSPSSRAITVPRSSKPGIIQIGIVPEGDIPTGRLEDWLDAQITGWNYLALGGGDVRRSLKLAGGLAHAPGTPQPLRPYCVGAHGCTFIELDPSGAVHQEQLRTATVRWERVVVECSTSTSWEELTEKMALQLLEYESHPVESLWNFEWVLRGRGDLFDGLAEPRRQKDLWDAIDHEAHSAEVRRRHQLTRDVVETGKDHEAAKLLKEFSETVTGVLNPQDAFWKQRGQLFTGMATPWGRKLAGLVENADAKRVAEEAQQLVRGWWT